MAALIGLVVLLQIDVTFLLLLFLVFGPPVLFLILGYAIVRAIRDLVRQPHVRRAANIRMAVGGLIALVLGGWMWYWVMWQLVGAALFFGGHS